LNARSSIHCSCEPIMSCHPPTRQVGPYQPEDGPHNEPTEQLALADLHVKPYAKRHVKVYADIPVASATAR